MDMTFFFTLLSSRNYFFFLSDMSLHDIFSPHVTYVTIFISSRLLNFFFVQEHVSCRIFFKIPHLPSKVKLVTPKFIVFFSTAGSLLRISEKLNEVVATARNMCNALTHCLDLLAQQEEVRLHSGFLDTALHVCCVNCTSKFDNGIEQPFHRTSKMICFS